MSSFKKITISLIVLVSSILTGCNQASSVANPNQANVTYLNLDVEAILKLDELTDANAEQLLLKQGDKSVVVAYSSKEASSAQTAQLEMIARDSHNYTGAIKFYRLDQAKYPKTWSDITRGVTWDKGPYFLLVNTNPAMIGTVKDLNGSVEEAVHTMSTDRLRAEVTRFLKIKAPVYHIILDEVDRLILQPGLPTFIMAYRNKGIQDLRTQHQRFTYESQLYAGRVNFVLLDLDQDNNSVKIGNKLGINLPNQNDPYYVVYDPNRRVGLTINNALLPAPEMEDAIRSYFGPGHEPAKVIP